jgi:hypothetical protein
MNKQSRFIRGGIAPLLIALFALSGCPASTGSTVVDNTGNEETPVHRPTPSPTPSPDELAAAGLNDDLAGFIADGDVDGTVNVVVLSSPLPLIAAPLPSPSPKSPRTRNLSSRAMSLPCREPPRSAGPLPWGRTQPLGGLRRNPHGGHRNPYGGRSLHR